MNNGCKGINDCCCCVQGVGDETITTIPITSTTYRHHYQRCNEASHVSTRQRCAVPYDTFDVSVLVSKILLDVIG
jgi:hypothetical protein